jgi:PAS domain S-box-containing protein
LTASGDTRHLFEPFRRLADSVPHVVWITQLHPEKVIYVSPSFEQIWGRSPQELYADPRLWTQAIHADDRAAVEAEFVRWITGNDRRCQKLEYRVVQPSGALRWITDYGVVTFDENGEAIRVSGVCTDITELKLAEHEHLAHLKFFENLDRVNQAIQGTDDLEHMMGDVLTQLLDIFDSDRAGLVATSDVEPAAARVLERTRQGYAGGVHAGTGALRFGAAAGVQRYGGHLDRPLPDDLPAGLRVQTMICSPLLPRAGSSYTLQLQRCRSPRGFSDEEERLFREIGRRLADAIGTLSTFRSLRESEARLEAAQRQAHLGYWSVDLQTQLVTWSAETYRICGMEPRPRPMRLDELKSLVHSGDLRSVGDAARRAMTTSGSYVVDHRVLRPNSELRYVHTEGHVVRDSDGEPIGLFGTAQDITERKRAEQLFAAQHAVTKLLAESTSPEDAAPRVLQAIGETLLWDLGVLWQQDPHTCTLRASDVWSTPAVSAPAFVASTRAADATPSSGATAPSRAPWFVSDLALETSTPRGRAAAQDGLHAAFGFSVQLQAEIWAVFEFVSKEVREPDAELLATMATLGSQLGQFVERRRAESALQHARDQLARVTRVASLGELTASIAHEVNQPLTGIVANAHAALRWLAREPPDLCEATEALQRLARDGKRAGEVVTRLRTLLRQGEATRKLAVDVNQIVRETLPLIRSELQQHDVRTSLALEESLPHVFADRVQIQQVVINLLLNAVEAMSALGTAPRELSVTSADDRTGSIQITVTDSGVGVRPEDREEIFSAFFTTKPRGMGMGLAISRSIVEDHGGRLTLLESKTRGSSFRFSLPRLQPDAAR